MGIYQVIRIQIAISVITVSVIVLSVYCGWLSYSELIKGSILGAIVSLMTSIPFQYMESNRQQNEALDRLIWEGFLPYSNKVDKICDALAPFERLEKLFVKSGATRESMEEGDWRVYKMFYRFDPSYSKHLVENVEEGIKNIASDDHFSLISSCLSAVENRSVIPKVERVEFAKAYNVYKIIDNARFIFDEANRCFRSLEGEEDEQKRICMAIGISRWLFWQMKDNEDWNVVDVPDNQVESDLESEIILMKKDLDSSIHELMKEKRRFRC